MGERKKEKKGVNSRHQLQDVIQTTMATIRIILTKG